MDPSLPPEPDAVLSTGLAPVAETVSPVRFAPARKHPWYSWRRLGYNFLTLSLLAHLLLAVGAAYLVVSVSYPKKKMFAAPPAGGAQRAAEHKVSMAKAQQRSSAPVAVKRVVTTGVSKVALPAMPVVATDSAVMPVSMSGMSGSGTGLMGGNGGSGSGNGNGNGNGIGGLTFFGVRSGGTGLTGTFYDLKQTQSRQPTGMTPDQYGAKVVQFAQGGFNVGVLASYYKANRPIYATHIFTPNIPAELGPKAFGVEKEVQPTMWLVHYKGSVTVPAGGTFRFVGMGDDLLLVKFNNRLMLDACWYIDTGRVQGQRHFEWDWAAPPGKGATEGPTFTVETGATYPMEVVIGEQPGGSSAAALLLQEEGKNYGKDARGANILPYFRMSSDTNLPPAPPPAPGGGKGGYAPHTSDGPVWRSVSATDSPSIFSH